MSTARVRLKNFRLRAYRSCKDTNLVSNENVTALIGPNGSGKTNLMHGMLLLGLGGRRRSRIDDDELYTRKCEVEAEFVVKRESIFYKASITYRPNELNRDDVVSLEERWNFQNVDRKRIWLRTEEIGLYFSKNRGVYLRFSPQYLPHKNIGYTVQKILRGPSSKLRKRIPSARARDAFECIQRFRANIKYYSASQFTNPALCPPSFEIDEDGDLRQESIVLRRSAHTRFMYELYKLSKDENDSYDAFLSLVDRRGVGLIEKIKWREVKFSSPDYEVRSGGRVISKKRTRIMIIPTVEIEKAQLSFNQLSEGTLRTLAMLFYVVTDNSELLLIEEPEVCVHHGLLRSVIEIIKEYARTKQIVFSTHSEIVVDSLKPEQVLLINKVKNQGTTVSPITEKMSVSSYDALKQYLATSGNLGEYWRHSGFGK